MPSWLRIVLGVLLAGLGLAVFASIRYAVEANQFGTPRRVRDALADGAVAAIIRLVGLLALAAGVKLIGHIPWSRWMSWTLVGVGCVIASLSYWSILHMPRSKEKRPMLDEEFNAVRLRYVAALFGGMVAVIGLVLLGFL